MVFGINNIEQSSFQPQLSQVGSYQRQASGAEAFEPLNSFDQEDEAIISSEATLQYETEKFNSGTGDAVDLALAEVMTKTTVSAEVSVINAKSDMLDTILGLGE